MISIHVSIIKMKASVWVLKTLKYHSDTISFVSLLIILLITLLAVICNDVNIVMQVN